MYTLIGDTTPNVKTDKSTDKVRDLVRYRKPKVELSDLERYADIITAYRELLSLSALAPDIQFGKPGPSAVPRDRERLLKWVEDPVNLDKVAESFRRTCSGFVSTGRLFAVQSGPFYMDWPAVVSMLKTGYDALYGAAVFMDISGRGKLAEEVEALNDCLEVVKQIQDSLRLADLCASLPTPEERVGKGVEQ